MCCGQKRLELRNGVTTRTTQSIRRAHRQHASSG